MVFNPYDIGIVPPRILLAAGVVTRDMKHMMIRYTVKPELVEENSRLVRAVFAELRASAPKGLRYASMTSGDGHFVHLVSTESDDTDALTSLGSFENFVRDVRERCAQAPETTDLTVVGNYRLLEG
jgi:hypothetical protein